MSAVSFRIKGAALITVILVSLVILTVGLALATMAVLHLNVARQMLDRTQTRYIAQAGLERVKDLVLNRPQSTSLTATSPFDLDAAAGLLLGVKDGFPGDCYLVPTTARPYYSTNNLDSEFPTQGWAAAAQVPPFALDVILRVVMQGESHYYEATLSQRWQYLCYSEHGPLNLWCSGGDIQGSVLGARPPAPFVPSGVPYVNVSLDPLGSLTARQRALLGVSPTPTRVEGDVCATDPASANPIYVANDVVDGTLRFDTSLIHVDLLQFLRLQNTQTVLPGIPLSELPRLDPLGHWVPYNGNQHKLFKADAYINGIPPTMRFLDKDYTVGGGAPQELMASLCNCVAWVPPTRPGVLPQDSPYLTPMTGGKLTISDGVFKVDGDMLITNLRDSNGMIIVDGSLFFSDAVMDAKDKPMVIITNGDIDLEGSGLYKGFIATTQSLAFAQGLQMTGGLLATTEAPAPGSVNLGLTIQDPTGPKAKTTLEFDPRYTKALNQFADLQTLTFAELP